MYHLCLLLISLASKVVSGGNILILNPSNAHSHVRLLGNLANILANDGHNVTILATVFDPTVTPFGTGHPNVHKILYKSPYISGNAMSQFGQKGEALWQSSDPEGSTLAWSDWRYIINLYKLSYKSMLEDDDLMRSLRDSKFDLGVGEIFELGVFGLMEALNIKSTMVVASMGMQQCHYEISGIPYFPSYVPFWSSTYSEYMSFWDRLNNYKISIEFQRLLNEDIESMNSLFREHHPDMPNVLDIAKSKTGVILSNTNEFTESGRLQSNAIQYIGGANVYPVKPVNQEINDILNMRPKNVFVSFGTFADICHMPPTLKKEILSAFSQFPNVTFMWKHEECEGDPISYGQYPNVLRKSWWPQSDILGDSRLSAFISHGGMNSITETVIRGVPTITVPITADQYLNAKTAVNRGTSIMIKRSELNSERLVEALMKILDENSSVAKKAKLAGTILKGKDEECRQAVLRWANLLIEFGPQEHLFLPSRNLNFFQLYSLDVLSFGTALLIFSAIAVVYCVKILFRGDKLKKL